jgi:hypothetical protein
VSEEAEATQDSETHSVHFFHACAMPSLVLGS